MCAGWLQVEDKEPLGPVSLLAEEVVRGSAAAALSQLLTAVEPRWAVNVAAAPFCGVRFGVVVAHLGGMLHARC